MSKHARICAVSLFVAMLWTTAPAMAQNRHESPGPDYGVALTPAVYFVNFLFMYFSNPENAANMPAYRAPIPGQLAACLLANPEGCSYADYQQYFNGQDTCNEGKGGGKCQWTPQCRLEPSTEHLAPPEFRDSSQINEGLGIAAATKLARKLDIDEKMILTPDEYQCLIGTPDERTDDQDTIVECIYELTNSNGVVDVPLSSYGLALDDPLQPDESRVRSVCAPDAPCLRMNQVITGSLDNIAATCGFSAKLDRLYLKTPMLKFGALGDVCQTTSIRDTGGACMAASIRRR
jgi:hypothetical protein